MKTFRDYYSLLFASKGNKRKGKIIRIPEVVSEAVQLKQLAGKDFISPITKKSFELGGKQLIIGTKLKNTNGSTMNFIVPSIGKEKSYRVQIACETLPTKTSELLKTNCKAHCNCGAFRNQGMQYKLSTLDAALRPEKIEDKVWGPRHENKNYVCKHIRAVVEKIKSSKKKTTVSLLKALKK